MLTDKNGEMRIESGTKLNKLEVSGIKTIKKRSGLNQTNNNLLIESTLIHRLMFCKMNIYLL